MSAQHTPGPWRAETRGWGNGFTHFVMAKRHTCIARTVSQESSDPKVKAQVAANTLLIAAAPELLDALQMIAANAEQLASDPMTANRGLWAGCAATARDAIAKATGK